MAPFRSINMPVKIQPHPTKPQRYFALTLGAKEGQGKKAGMLRNPSLFLGTV